VSTNAPARPEPGGHREAQFSHEALLYHGDGDFLTATVPFVREGVARDEAVLVVVAAHKIARLSEALGDAAKRVQFADMEAVGLNPARIIPAWQDFVADHAGERRPLRGIGEPISATRTADQLVECQRHETLLNVAFAGGVPWRLLCPYDVTSLSPLVIAEAQRSHPFILDRSGATPSTDYRGLTASGEPFDVPLPEPPSSAIALTVESSSLRDVRLFIENHTRGCGFTADDARDFALAAHEIAANSLRYGGGSATLRVWSDDDTLICDVRDRGSITAPLAGRQRPSVLATEGRGLWLANHLCDLVQIRSTASGGAVRLHKFRS
jgi:anti-sigma regulatory factor (Ser/Thr protein kinase)